MNKTLLLSLVLLACQPALAQESFSDAQLQDLLRVKIRTVQHLALNPVLVRAVRRQNREALTAEEIQRRDQRWKAATELSDFQRALQHNEAGRFLKLRVGEGSTFTEAFLTDALGANVAAYPATSDYWQGDEEKWSGSFAAGAGRIFVGPLEHDESTNQYSVQISAPVLDGRETIGVLVVGVSLGYLQERSAN